MPRYDRRNLTFQDRYDTFEELGVAVLVVIKATDKFLSSVLDNITGQRQAMNVVVGVMAKFKRALITKFTLNVFCTSSNGSCALTR